MQISQNTKLFKGSNLPNIAIIIPSDILRYYPFGGALSYVINFCEIYNGELIILDATTNKSELFLRRSLNFHGKNIISVPVLYLNKNSKIPIRFKSFFRFLFTKRIYKIIEDYPILYIHMPEAVLGFLLRKKKKIIYHLHGCDNPLKFSTYPFFRNKIFQILYEKFITSTIIKKVDFLITINKDCENYIKKFKIIKNSKNIPNLVNSNIFYPVDRDICRQKLNLNTKSEVYLMVCRIEEVKGIQHIIKVFNKLIKINSNIVLLIAGSGTMLNKYKSEVKNLKMDKNIIFLGMVEYEKLPYYYNAADCYVLASYSEGTPMSILESMSVGIPIISSNVGNINILLKDYHSKLIINGFNIDEWVQEIQNFKLTKNKFPFVFKIDFEFFKKLIS